jgi:hypothetical protein
MVLKLRGKDNNCYSCGNRLMLRRHSCLPDPGNLLTYIKWVVPIIFDLAVLYFAGHGSGRVKR